MKLSEHKIFKVLKEMDPKKYKVVAGETSGNMKLGCYALKKLEENEITATYENLCVALWIMFPKVEKFHLYGFDDIPDTDLMEKLIKLRSWHDYKVFGGGNTKDKKISKPWYLTEKGGLWAREAEAILTGKIVSSAKEKLREKGTSKNYVDELQKIIDSELHKIYQENPNQETVRKSMIASALEIYFIDKTFLEDFNKKKKEIFEYMRERKTEKKNTDLDKQIKDFLDWIQKYVL